MSDVTRIITAFEQGDQAAAEQLLPLVYDELRRLAAHKLASEHPGHTLQATALVHEAYLRLAEGASQPAWQNRRHFFAAAAEAMRRILIESARRRNSLKQGGDLKRVNLDPDLIVDLPGDVDFLSLNEALEQLAVREPRKAALVNLRFFAGLSLEEAAGALEISPATAKRDWIYARSWLYGCLSGENSPKNRSAADFA